MTQPPDEDPRPEDRPAYPSQPPPGPGYPPQQPGYGYPPQQPGYGHPGQPPYRLPDHPDATKALVVGIIALVGGFTCYLPVLLGPWAWATGRRAVKEIDAQPGRYEGRGQALAGYVMGVVATVLLALGVLALIALLVFAFGMGGIEAQPLDGQSL